MRDTGGEMAASADDLIELVPQQQESLHYFFALSETSDSQAWRAFSDQFL